MNVPECTGNLFLFNYFGPFIFSRWGAGGVALLISQCIQACLSGLLMCSSPFHYVIYMCTTWRFGFIHFLLPLSVNIFALPTLHRWTQCKYTLCKYTEKSEFMHGQVCSNGFDTVLSLLKQCKAVKAWFITASLYGFNSFFYIILTHLI